MKYSFASIIAWYSNLIVVNLAVVSSSSWRPPSTTPGIQVLYCFFNTCSVVSLTEESPLQKLLSRQRLLFFLWTCSVYQESHFFARPSNMESWLWWMLLLSLPCTYSSNDSEWGRFAMQFEWKTMTTWGGRWCWRALLLYSVYCVCTWTAILKSPSHISWSEVRLLPLQDAIDTRKWLNAWFLCLLGCLLGAPLHLIIAHGHSTPRYTTCSNWSKVGRFEKMYQQNEDRHVWRSAHS
jgi:hypothetical protein